MPQLSTITSLKREQEIRKVFDFNLWLSIHSLTHSLNDRLSNKLSFINLMSFLLVKLTLKHKYKHKHKHKHKSDNWHLLSRRLCSCIWSAVLSRMRISGYTQQLQSNLQFNCEWLPLTLFKKYLQMYSIISENFSNKELTFDK